MTSTTREHLRRYAFLLIPPLFFLATMGKKIGFGDTALLVNDIQRGGLESHVNNHPLTVATGVIFNALIPASELAVRANLVSVFYGSLTLMIFYYLLLTYLGSITSAVMGASLLMICHSMWWHSTVIENYAATSFLTALCLLCWSRLEQTDDRKWLYWLCGFAGLGVFNHVQMGFVCLGVLVTGLLIAKRDDDFKNTLLGCAGGALLGLLPWLSLLVRDAMRLNSLSTAIKGAFVGSFKDTFFGGGFWSSLNDTAYTLWFQSPTLYMVGFGIVGIVLAFRQDRKSPALIGMMVPFVINTVNFTFYPTWDKFAFLLQSFVILHFFASRALHATREYLAERNLGGLTYAYVAVSLVVPPYLYENIATWALDSKSAFHQRYNNFYSDNVYFQSEFIVNPDKSRYTEVDDFAKALFEKLPQGATFLDDDSRTYYPLADYFQKHYKIRPDVSVLLVNSWGIANWGLGSETVADIITKAYYLDKPFFTISTKHPISTLVVQAQKKVPDLDFVKFPLRADRWVYRLVTQSESKSERKIAVEDLSWVKTQNLIAPSGYFDLSLPDIVYFSTGSFQMQEMKTFLGKWHGNDQLFFSGEKPGASIEFFLNSKESRNVDLTLWLTSAPDFGKVKIEVLPSRSEVTVDLYESAVQPTKITLSDVAMTNGVNQIRFTVLEKNSRSSGYHLGIDGIEYVTKKR